MKRNFFPFLIVLLFVPSLACVSLTTNSVVGSGDIVNQTFDVSNFNHVTLEGSGYVFIEQGQTESLSVQTDNNIIPLLDIKVSGNELTLGTKQGFEVTPSQSIIYNLTVQDLNNITLVGSGTFDVGPVESSDLTISIQGSGDVNIKSLTAEDLSIDVGGSGNITVEHVSVKTVDTSIRGSGDIKLEGKANTQKVTVGGSGNYLAGNLQTDTADISVPGSADVIIWVKDELTIKVNGSGDIQYYGEPVTDQSGSGSGDVTPLGEK